MTEENVTLEQSLRELYYDPVSGTKANSNFIRTQGKMGCKSLGKKQKSGSSTRRLTHVLSNPQKGFEEGKRLFPPWESNSKWTWWTCPNTKTKTMGTAGFLPRLTCFQGLPCHPARRKHKEFVEPAVRRVFEEHKEKFDKYPDSNKLDST